MQKPMTQLESNPSPVARKTDAQNRLHSINPEPENARQTGPC
jgi:hypothetical protein